MKQAPKDTSFYNPNAETNIEIVMRTLKSPERVRATGEVFTPPELINEMLDKLPEGALSDKTKNFLEPAAGNGNFVIEVLKRKLDSGLTTFETLVSLHAVELMPDNVIMGRHRVLQLFRKYDPSFEQNLPDYVEIINLKYRCGNTLTAPIGDPTWWYSDNTDAVPDIKVSDVKDLPELLSPESYHGFMPIEAPKIKKQKKPKV